MSTNSNNMIHPQYIVGLFDSVGKFEVRKYKSCYKFRIIFYSTNIQVLYKIKKRFKIGKIRNNVLIIDKQLDVIINFFYKNKLMTKKSIELYKFAYLYQKMIIEKKSCKTEKEFRKIINKLTYFLC